MTTVTVHVLFDMHADSWSGAQTFLGVFGSEQQAIDYVREKNVVWQRNPEMPLEPYFKTKPYTVEIP